jgi:hypothetical protein
MLRLNLRIGSAAHVFPFEMIPDECWHPFHFKAATDSGEYCHPPGDDVLAF